MKINVKEIKKTIRLALSNSPIEIALSLIFLAIASYKDFADNSAKIPDWIENIQYYFFVCMATAYSLNILFRTGRKRMFYYISLLTPVLFYFYSQSNFSYTTFTITSLCALLLIYVANDSKNNEEFTRNAISTTINLLAAGGLSLVATLALQSITTSIHYIFDIEYNTELISRTIINLGIYIMPTLLFLYFEYKQNTEIKTNRFLNIFFNYILTPAILIYGIILYVYFAKIVYIWTLPQGVISATAMCFLIGALFVKACRIILDKKLANWFFDYFSYLSIPALGMLWVSAIYRISQYGFTEDRVYLIISILTLTIWIAAALYERFNKYRYLTIFTIAIYIAFTYIPIIKANDLDQEGKKTTELEPMYLSFKNNDINIQGFSNLYHISYSGCKSNKDSIVIRDKSDSLLFKKSSDEVLTKIFTEVGIENYHTLTDDGIDSLSNKMGIYRDSTIIISISNISLIKENDSIYLDHIGIDYVVTK